MSISVGGAAVKEESAEKIRLESLQSFEAGIGGGGWTVDGEELGERLIRLQREKKAKGREWQPKALSVAQGGGRADDET